VDDSASVVIDTTREPSDQIAAHARYALTLADSGNDAYSGRVQYTSSGGRHYVLLIDSADVLVSGPSGVTLDPVFVTRAGMVPGCESLAGLVEVELPQGESTFTFSNAQQAVVEVVIHQAGSSHDHGDHSH